MRKKSAAYIEMLFENRNKAYGAYDLRVNYETRLIKSFGIALLIAGFFFLIPFVLTKLLTQEEHAEAVTTYCPIDLTQKFEIEKPQQVSMKQASMKNDAGQKTASKESFKIVDEKEIGKDELKKDPGQSSPLGSEGSGVSSDTSASAKSSDGESSDSGNLETGTMSVAGVDVIPEFPGGEAAMLEYISTHLRYPEVAKENKVIGRVFVTFVIDEKGKVTEIKIMRGLGYGTEEAVEQVISGMPDWSPGKFHGRNVKTAFIMPVRFSLK